MTLTTADDTAIHLLDSPRDVTAKRYMLFNQQWLKQTTLGSGGEDQMSHINRLSLFLKNGDIEAARGEFDNYLLTMHTIQHAENPLALALACLIDSIGGEACSDLSEEGLERTAARLLNSGLTQGQLYDTVETVKKNYNLL